MIGTIVPCHDVTSMRGTILMLIGAGLGAMAYRFIATPAGTAADLRASAASLSVPNLIKKGQRIEFDDRATHASPPSSTCAVCDDLNCPLRPVVALAEICNSKTLISFAVGTPIRASILPDWQPDRLFIPPSWHLYRAHSQRRETSRSAGRSSPQKSSLPSTSRPPRRSALPSRKRCWPPPTRLFNEDGGVHRGAWERSGVAGVGVGAAAGGAGDWVSQPPIR